MVAPRSRCAGVEPARSSCPLLVPVRPVILSHASVGVQGYLGEEKGRRSGRPSLGFYCSLPPPRTKRDILQGVERPQAQRSWVSRSGYLYRQDRLPSSLPANHKRLWETPTASAQALSPQGREAMVLESYFENYKSQATLILQPRTLLLPQTWSSLHCQGRPQPPVTPRDLGQALSSLAPLCIAEK